MQTCVTDAASGCTVWSAAESCGEDALCVGEGECRSCSGTAGTHREQELQVGGEDRYYYLYVPTSYECGTPMPVLVDFHGSAVDVPEEAYGLSAARELAREEGFILVRPRSRSSLEGGQSVYRWDQNAGDLARNVAFTQELLAALKERYHLDSTRTYAMGFSSGTNMAMQFFGRKDNPFSGFGLIGGGLWSPVEIPDLDQTAPRVYAATGYRDYMFSNFRPLRDELLERGLPADRFFIREADSGHELYDWHYPELWAWLDRGERPFSGVLAEGWTQEQTGTGQPLLELARAPSGKIFAAAGEGHVLERTGDGVWSIVARLRGPRVGNFTGLCFLDDGTGVAVGETQLAIGSAQGTEWRLAAPVPEFGPMGFGASYLNGVACRGATVVGGGMWTGARSHDNAQSWVAELMENFGFPAQIMDVAITPNGTSIAVGYWKYLGVKRAVDDAYTVPLISHPSTWLTAIATTAEASWVVGDNSGVLRSLDDGTSWIQKYLPTERDLYAVAALDDQRAAVAGAGGLVMVTHDGGDTWSDYSLGLDLMIADVLFLDQGSLLVVGESGSAFVRSLE